ncbi:MULTISPECIES: hypothetical protein [unclassified Sulfitobacter]|nr:MULTISPECIES: hypothetical protein [unclassified Sulfitobacter]
MPPGLGEVPHDVAALVPLLDQLCPLHLMMDGAGHIRHAGPTMQKLRPDRVLEGAQFSEVFRIRRPRGGRRLPDSLQRAQGRCNWPSPKRPGRR